MDPDNLSAETAGHNDTPSPSSPARAKPVGLFKVLSAAIVGTFLEWFDFALFAYSVTIIAGLFFPSENSGVSLFYTFVAVYGLSFIVRPLGGIVWGHLGDRIGRRPVLVTIVVLMGAATALVGLLPTYAAIGIAAPALLITLRLVQSFCTGGEAVGAQAYVLENIEPGRRGLWLGLVNSMAVVPFAVAATLVVALSTLMGQEAYNSWGWRVLFLIGGGIAVLGLLIRRKLPEAREFEEIARADTKSKVPLLESLSRFPRRMAAVFFVIGLGALTFYVLTGFLSTYLIERLNVSPNGGLLTNACALLSIAVIGPLIGYMSDRVQARRPFILVGCCLIALGIIPAFWLASSGGLIGALAAQLMIGISIGMLWGGGVPLMTEIFPTRVRYSGAAVSYNVAYAVFGGTAPMISQAIANRSVNDIAPSFYVAAVAGVCAVACFLVVPETAPNHPRGFDPAKT